MKKTAEQLVAEASSEIVTLKPKQALAMQEAGVPCIPGYEGDSKDLNFYVTRTQQGFFEYQLAVTKSTLSL